MQEFCIKVTRDHRAKITSLYSPDLDMELLESNLSTDISDDYRSYVHHFLTEMITNNVYNITPKTLKQLKQHPLISLQHWEIFDIDLKAKNGFFSKALPIAGQIANVLTILSSGVITFMTLRLVNAGSNNGTNEFSASSLLGILGIILKSFVSTIIYIYSDATKMLINVGQNIDHSLVGMCGQDYEILMIIHKNNDNAYLKRCISLLTAGGIITNIIISAVTLHQQFILVADKYFDSYPNLSDSEREKDKELIKWLVININIFAWVYINLAFQGSFAAKFIKNTTNTSEQNETVLNPNKPPKFQSNSLLFQFNRPPTMATGHVLFSNINAQEQFLPVLENPQLTKRKDRSLSI